ncbi:MAG: transglycosylase SLT domain-containing protein [Pseudomonadota bacterium]
MFNLKLLSHSFTLILSLSLLILPVFVLAEKIVPKKSVKIKADIIKVKKHVIKNRIHVKHKHWTKKYDSYFKKYSKHYFGLRFPWLWFKAQSIAESGLNVKAKSKVGAVGLMQIMPSTYSDIVKKNPKLGDINHPRWNVAAGIFYDRQIYRKWKDKGIPNSQRLSFTFASYNAGYSKILRAYNKANKGLDIKQQQWSVVKLNTPNETRAYVHRIKNLMDFK